MDYPYDYPCSFTDYSLMNCSAINDKFYFEMVQDPTAKNENPLTKIEKAIETEIKDEISKFELLTTASKNTIFFITFLALIFVIKKVFSRSHKNNLQIHLV